MTRTIGTNIRQPLRLTDLFLLLAVPVLAVAVLFWVSQPVEPFQAQVIESSVTPTEDGFVGNVTWIDDEGVRRVTQIEMTPDQVESGTVFLLASEGADIQVVDSPEPTGVSPTAVLTTAAIALAFAIVVLATIRGFGYVRGTGNYGEMTPEEVRESRAFYWRQ